MTWPLSPPNHFLHGQLGGNFIPETVDEVALNPRKRWPQVQELVRHFWHRWLREWIPSLSGRKTWRSDRDDLKAGYVVSVMSTDTPKGKWTLGWIVKAFPGKDNKVRVVEVQVGRTVFRRPNVKLWPLEHQWLLFYVKMNEVNFNSKDEHYVSWKVMFNPDSNEHFWQENIESNELDN